MEHGPLAQSGPLDPSASIREPVKLVVWDLDETFWQGTLGEGAITPLPRNIALVKTLAARGIVSSIASKNDRAAVSAELERLGIADHFVAPAIAFQPKGTSIAALIEALRLRPANVVFIDDNPSVLAEAGFACPGLVCLDHPDRLAEAMDGEALRGQPDPDLSRLQQYRELAARHDVQTESGGDAVAFLRQSAIRVEIDYDVEPHLDRVIELINRANQLNYTKRRIETPEARAQFIETLRKYGFKAGIVRVSDRYADYGIVGFFLTLATLRGYELRHFVFSCRIMNMGIEQYVYDLLNRPAIDVTEPVANPITSFAAVDWITEGGPQGTVSALRDKKLALIGGCDMLQLSTYCSMDSIEFTNRDANGLMKRLDDPFFILEDDPKRIQASAIRPRLPAFDAEDIELRNAALESADAFIVSFYRMMDINYFRDRDALTVRLDEEAVKSLLGSNEALWFVRNLQFVRFSHEERCDLVRRSLWRLAERSRPQCRIIVLTENTRKHEDKQNALRLRTLYNEMVARICRASDKFVLLDVNTVTDEKWVWDDGFHMHRQGYFELAQAVKAILAPDGRGDTIRNTSRPSAAPFPDASLFVTSRIRFDRQPPQ
ncbi:hypothetical protein B2G71_14310 [Novosphingobium sp. PC22D]|uniref:hypothetical protein n=1 Tax=Novosphingobium sp. PC22D TaxID=1962403 RepID=UPI000BEF92DA|nr:hypothetical protein [Novosphingobium sp. PC22D]PEQ11950.1 hypothetical protein B2G71_14310 [Novosphingobium sp. PC22D]